VRESGGARSRFLSVRDSFMKSFKILVLSIQPTSSPSARDIIIEDQSGPLTPFNSPIPTSHITSASFSPRLPNLNLPDPGIISPFLCTRNVMPNLFNPNLPQLLRPTRFVILNPNSPSSNLPLHLFQTRDRRMRLSLTPNALPDASDRMTRRSLFLTRSLSVLLLILCIFDWDLLLESLMLVGVSLLNCAKTSSRSFVFMVAMKVPLGVIWLTLLWLSLFLGEFGKGYAHFAVYSPVCIN
jgi:hypothetical protein